MIRIKGRKTKIDYISKIDIEVRLIQKILITSRRFYITLGDLVDTMNIEKENNRDIGVVILGFQKNHSQLQDSAILLSGSWEVRITNFKYHRLQRLQTHRESHSRKN